VAKPNADAQRKAKEKKQKIILAVGGVLLLGLLGLQGPKTLAKLHQKPPPLPGQVLPPNGNPPGVTTPSLAAPTLAGGNGATAAAGGGGSTAGGTNPAAGDGPASKLAVFEVSPDPVQGQLRSFSRFVSKDPFQQQLVVDANGNQVTPASGSTGSSGSSGSPGGGLVGGGSAGSGGSTGGGSAPPTAVSAVKIAVNGDPAASVGVGSDFPTASPVFHLLSATSVSARVTIAGGSYADGRSAVALHVGKPLTLENTADGTRYKLVLLGPG
jgi:hypothetical protein